MSREVPAEAGQAILLFANAVINPDSVCAHLDGLDTHMRVGLAGSSQAIDAASFQVRVYLQNQLPMCSKTHIGIWFFLQCVPIQSLQNQLPTCIRAHIGTWAFSHSEFCHAALLSL